MSDIIGNITSANIDGTVQTNSSISGSLYPKGEKGDPGNGINKIEYTSSVGNIDTYTIFFDNGTTTTFTVTNGTNGADGKGLEFNWQGTQLGVRVEGSSQYTYVDLKGQDGHTPVKGTDYFTAAEIADIESDIISQIDTLKKQIVQTLPVSDIDPNTIYLVPKQTSSQGDIYDEYLYINNAWEHIGSTEVDLTNYYNKTQTDALLNAKQATLVSGTNIKTINNNSLLGSGNIEIEGNEIFIGNEEDAPQEAKIVIDPDEDIPIVSEVVNSLEGNEINKAPSVRAVKEESEIYSTSEQRIGTWVDGKPLYRITIVNTLGTTNDAWKDIQVFGANYVDTVINYDGVINIGYGTPVSFWKIPYIRLLDANYANREYVICSFTKSTGIFTVRGYHPNAYAEVLSGKPIIAHLYYTKTAD